jgi:5-methylcytosine-specific restriction protein B
VLDRQFAWLVQGYTNRYTTDNLIAPIKQDDRARIPVLFKKYNLQLQFAEATDDQRLLMAEVVALQVLPIGWIIGHAKKRERVQTMLDLMDHPVQIPRVFDEAFSGGAFNPGQGMQTHINRAIAVTLDVLLAWSKLDDDAQADSLANPIAWRDVVMTTGDAFPTQRYALLYLVHPGFFGPIVAPDHRSRIRSAFIGEIGGAFSDDPDADLQQILIALQTKDGKPVNLYDEPLRSSWQSEDAAVIEPLHEEPKASNGTDAQSHPRGFFSERGRHDGARRRDLSARRVAC